MNIQIIVATHKPYWMPEDGIYLPLQVGREGRPDLGYTGDNTGENISAKNANYCELTGLYWAWKNLRADYIGLAHYRRHFTARHGLGASRARILTRAEAERLLERDGVLLPKLRRYWIETNYSQYAHAHHAVDLDITRAILAERHPEYLPAWDASMKRTCGHRFNMFIMRRDLLDAYCQWLFGILFALESRLDIRGYSANDARVFGFVGERLLDVWLDANGVAYREIPWMYMERQNWLAKGGLFLLRKLTARDRRWEDANGR